MPKLVVKPATAQRWDDVVAAFGRRGDDPSWCWCRRFLTTDQYANTGTGPDNRHALRQEITTAARPPGLVCYADGQPVGWSRVGPRASFAGVTGNRALARILTDDPHAWWITCFAVEGRHRRVGVGAALLDAAAGFAREHHATVLDGHPVDVDALRARRVSGSALFTGSMAMFVAAGFSEIGRTYASRPVMRRTLRGP